MRLCPALRQFESNRSSSRILIHAAELEHGATHRKQRKELFLIANKPMFLPNRIKPYRNGALCIPMNSIGTRILRPDAFYRDRIKMHIVRPDAFYRDAHLAFASPCRVSGLHSDVFCREIAHLVPMNFIAKLKQVRRCNQT
jgi:hypothetical protein